jgi:hypothetical protein
MDFKALEENFKQLNAQMEAARKEMQAKSTGFVEAACKQFFDACPEVEAVQWTQYTPYFNDGETCEFSVHEKYFILVGDEDPDDYEGSVTYNEKDLAKAEKDLAEAVAYVKDPIAWAEKYKREYKARCGREYSSGYYNSRPKPYPSDPAEAQERIDTIKEFLAKYPDGTMERIETAFESLTKALDLIDEDIMQAIYGDHAKITITRSGTEIDEYDHD